MRFRGMSALRSIQSESSSRSSISRTSVSAVSSSVCCADVKPRIRHHPIGHEISQEKPFGETEFLPAAKEQLLGLLHFLLTLNFYFRLGHVQGSPLGSHKLYSISVVLSTDPAQNRRYNLVSNCMPFWPLTGPRPGHVEHKVTPATRSLFCG